MKGYIMAWEDIGKRAQSRLYDSIPAEWRTPTDKLPPADQKDVTGFPYQSGLFTEREILITNSLATDIVAKIANSTWTAEEVTRAFCRRAAIAHQLVLPASNCMSSSYLSWLTQESRRIA